MLYSYTLRYVRLNFVSISLLFERFSQIVIRSYTFCATVSQMRNTAQQVSTCHLARFDWQGLLDRPRWIYMNLYQCPPIRRVRTIFIQYIPSFLYVSIPDSYHALIYPSACIHDSYPEMIYLIIPLTKGTTTLPSWGGRGGALPPSDIWPRVAESSPGQGNLVS